LFHLYDLKRYEYDIIPGAILQCAILAETLAGYRFFGFLKIFFKKYFSFFAASVILVSETPEGPAFTG